MTADELEAEYAEHALRPFTAPGILMLDGDRALEFVERARTARVPVLGVNGFILQGERTISPLEHLADYSRAVGTGQGCWDAAAAFIRERRMLDLAFEVVLGGSLPLSKRDDG